MKPAALLLALVALGRLLPGAPAPAAEPGPSRFFFLDDDDRRPLARIDLRVRERGGRPTLELAIRAVAPGVAPIPGFRGVAGANRYTAEQFERLLMGGARVRVETRRGGAAPWLGSLHAGKFAVLPERRLRPDRSIDYLARTERAYPVELLVDAGPLQPGHHVVEIIVDGSPRLRVECDYGESGLRLTAAESLAAGPVAAKEAVLQADQEGDDPEKAEKPLPAPVADADWNKRDLEGKWALYRESVVRTPKQRNAWSQYLLKRRDFVFLEQIALYDDPFIVPKLAKAKAPQWPRLVAWFIEGAKYSNHGESVFQTLLLKQDPGVALAWLNKHEAKLPQKGLLAKTHAALRAAAPVPAPIDDYLPPLTAKDVFRHLDAPATVEDFGTRNHVDEGKTYLHQVERALQGVVHSGAYQEPWLGKARQLTRHSDVRVRQAAYLAYSHLLNYDPRQEKTMAEFLAVVDDAQEGALVREAAFLALSDVYHPKIVLASHRLALLPAHPAWSAAVSRLGGDAFGYSLEVLKSVPTRTLNDDQAAVLKDARKRSEELAVTLTQPEGYLTIWLESAAWADLTDDPRRKPLANWTKDYFKRHGGDRVDAQLRHLLSEYRPTYALPGREQELRERVLGLAREIQDGRK